MYLVGQKMKIPEMQKTKNEISSSENTPGQNKYNGFNLSFTNNLLSKDLLKKLEAESPIDFEKYKFYLNFKRKKLDYCNEDLYFRLIKENEINQENLHSSKNYFKEEEKVGLEINSK